MAKKKQSKNISAAATEVLKELDDWTTKTENGAVKIFKGHSHKLCQLINQLLYVCYLEYVKTASSHLQEVMRLIVSDALGWEFNLWLSANAKFSKQKTFMQLSITYLEDPRNTDGFQALFKALEMLQAGTGQAEN